MPVDQADDARIVLYMNWRKQLDFAILANTKALRCFDTYRRVVCMKVSQGQVVTNDGKLN